MPIKNYLKSIGQKLWHLNDSPHRIALGFALGIFFGILPGAGPIAAATVAFIFRVNPVAAVTGSLLTNTWLSFVTWIPALELGSLVTGGDGPGLYAQTQELIKNFSLSNLWDISVVKILKPFLIGNVVIAASLSLMTYVVTRVIFVKRRKRLSAKQPAA